MIIKTIIVPILLMIFATLCVLACLSEQVFEHKILYAVFTVALFILLLVNVSGVIG